MSLLLVLQHYSCGYIIIAKTIVTHHYTFQSPKLADVLSISLL